MSNDAHKSHRDEEVKQLSALTEQQRKELAETKALAASLEAGMCPNGFAKFAM